jgi:hypothetical protein
MYSSNTAPIIKYLKPKRKQTISAYILLFSLRVYSLHISIGPEITKYYHIISVRVSSRRNIHYSYVFSWHRKNTFWLYSLLFIVSINGIFDVKIQTMLRSIDAMIVTKIILFLPYLKWWWHFSRTSIKTAAKRC